MAEDDPTSDAARARKDAELFKRYVSSLSKTDFSSTKSYVTSVSNSPVANATFLAVQALTHPDRTLFVETGPAGPEAPARWHILPYAQPAVTPSPLAAAADPSERVPESGAEERPRKREAAREPGDRATEPKHPIPILTPGFNFALRTVAILTFLALLVEIGLAVFVPGQPSPTQQGLSATADWILKAGLGAFLGMLGTRTAQARSGRHEHSNPERLS